jgi:hypothetical protein
MLCCWVPAPGTSSPGFSPSPTLPRSVGSSSHLIGATRLLCTYNDYNPPKCNPGEVGLWGINYLLQDNNMRFLGLVFFRESASNRDSGLRRFYFIFRICRDIQKWSWVSGGKDSADLASTLSRRQLTPHLTQHYYCTVGASSWAVRENNASSVTQTLMMPNQLCVRHHWYGVVAVSETMLMQLRLLLKNLCGCVRHR